MKYFEIKGIVKNGDRHLCNCEYCDISEIDFEVTYSHFFLSALSKEEAKEAALTTFVDDYDESIWEKIAVRELEVPEGKFVFTEDVYINDGYVSNGFLIIKEEKAHILEGCKILSRKPNIADFVNEHWEKAKGFSPVKFSKFVKRKKDVAASTLSNRKNVYINLEWYQQIADCGWELIPYDIQKPVAIVEDGECIGFVMPMNFEVW